MGKWINKNTPNKKKDNSYIKIIVTVILEILLLAILFLFTINRTSKKSVIFSYDHTSLTISTTLEDKTLKFIDSDTYKGYKINIEISSTSDNVTLGMVDTEDSYLYKVSSLSEERNLTLSFSVFDINRSTLLEVSDINYQIYLGETGHAKTALNDGYTLLSNNNKYSLNYILKGSDIYLYSFTIGFRIKQV